MSNHHDGTCPVCGKEVPSGRFYCSDKCQRKDYKKRYSNGDNGASYTKKGEFLHVETLKYNIVDAPPVFRVSEKYRDVIEKLENLPDGKWLAVSGFADRRALRTFQSSMTTGNSAARRMAGAKGKTINVRTNMNELILYIAVVPKK